MGTFIFFIIFFAVILPRLRGEQGGKKTFYTYTPPRKEYGAKSFYDRKNRAEEYTYEQEAADIQDMKPAHKHGGKKPKDPLQKKMVQTLLAIIGGAVGAGLLGTMALSAIGEVIWTLTNGYFFPDDFVLPVLFSVGTFGCCKIVKNGFQAWNRIKLFRLYNAIIGDQKVCPVSDIARSSGRKKNEVLRDMNDMVRRGYFPKGFVDEDTMNYYADNESWREMHPDRAKKEDEPIRKPRKRRKPAAKKTDAAKKETETNTADKEKTEPEGETSAVEKYLENLDKQITQIKQPEIHTKAKRLYEHSCDILAWVQLHPECAEDVRRFCSYYLPTATKLLSTYNEVAPHADESRVAASIQDEVSHVLDTMIEAFRGLMDNLLQNTAVDMQAEISALETVLSQEGLVENGFSMPQSAAPELKLQPGASEEPEASETTVH